jgi:hypothetical protein
LPTHLGDIDAGFAERLSLAVLLQVVTELEEDVTKHLIYHGGICRE